MSSRRLLPTTFAAVALLVAFSGQAAAETGEETLNLPRGELIDGVETLAADNSETFALYLPSAYTPERTWPILFVLDPRSRGRAAAELFRQGAERFGYIVVSSNSTLSDTLPEDNPNIPAMVALLGDAMNRFAADENRVYLAGFSGTARFAWSVGFGVKGQIAGVIGCGGALPGPLEQWGDVAFDYFGAAGDADFNHREMQLLDDQLDATEVTHRFEFFAGGHQWAPPEVLSQALGWMDTQAMKAGRRERDAALIEDLYTAGEAEAKALETGGSLHAAYLKYRQLAADFSGLRTIDDASEQAQRLAKQSQVKRDISEIRDAYRREYAYRQRLDAILARAAAASPLPPLKQVLGWLKIPQLQRKADGESIAARSARRQLESAFVQTSFYQPRSLKRAGEHERALLVLQVATEIKPDHWRPWFGLATGYAETGRSAKALQALERSIANGFNRRSTLEGESAFDSLRDSEGFQKILGSLEPAESAR